MRSMFKHLFTMATGITLGLSVGEAAPLPRTDANGNPLRQAATGHISNYDEAKVGTYTLPDPLVLRNGQPVRDADTWFKQRRPELIALYETEIYGRVPAQAPAVRAEVVGTDGRRTGGERARLSSGAGDQAGAAVVARRLRESSSAPR